MATALRMPQLGESVVEGTVGKWLKSVGDEVEKYEPLLEVVTDKVDSEITSPGAGYVLQIYAEEGETVQAGRLLAYIGEKEEPVPEPGSPEALEIVKPHGAEEEPTPSQAPPPPQEPERAAKPEQPRAPAPRVSPVVARIAAEHDVDLSEVSGTGRGGRVSKKDILRYIETRDATLPREQKPGEFFHPPGEKAAEPTPAPEAAPEEVEPPPTAPTARPGELLALTPMRRAIAEHMVRSVHTSPHVSTVFEVNCSKIVAHRAANKADYAQKGIKLTFTPYFVLATVDALKRVPVVNSTFTDAGIQLKREINIGVAVAVDEGLIVPVIKNADEKSLLGVTREVNDLAQRARAKQLKPDEVQGGTFTITNHGVSGSLVALPIINQPQAAILGVGMIEKRVVVVENDAIAIRPLAYLSLTFDHRIMDGAVADRFMTALKQRLEGWD
jgi:2-oxoisovalerate dehydrogenase E2 component (dihydrolipoyl transacylase)